MCGISGKIYFDPQRKMERDIIMNMSQKMVHRGPDDLGLYVNGCVGLGHNRLSIIDLDTGKQPISNEDSTIWIVFNGEIYNFKELRTRLLAKGHVFRTKTDTEVIVHLYEEYGFDCLKELRGMFSFAIWDESKKQLFMARDRVGIKPLYFRVNRESLEFASEIKAFCTDHFPFEPDIAMVDRFLSYYYTPGTRTIFKNIFKLDPGFYIVVEDGKWKKHRYWDLDFSERRDLRFEETRDELIALIDDTTKSHLISDVPVGFLLSGGVDSTSLLSLAINHTEKEISTFTVGFAGQEFDDERPYARLASNRYGTTHYETTISSRQFTDLLPKYIWHMEEPVCEPPGIAHYLITAFA